MHCDEVVLANKENGKHRTALIGFSWTTLIFGIFSAVFKKDWKWAIIGLLIAILSNVIFNVI